jgi:putative transposase
VTATGKGSSHHCTGLGLSGQFLLEQSDEWAVQRARYMTLETIAPLSDDLFVKLLAVTA